MNRRVEEMVAVESNLASGTLPTAARSLRALDDLPGPRGVPLLGNLLQIRIERIHQTVEQWCRQYGPLFRFRLASGTFLVVADPEALSLILRDRPDGFRRSDRVVAVAGEMGLTVPGVFGAEGDAWRAQRRMVMASFDPAHIKAYFPSLLNVTQRLHRRWQNAARARRSIDLQADLMRYTVDAVAGLAFGTDINTLESDAEVIQQHLDKIFPALMKRMFTLVPYWRWVKLPADRRLDRSVAAIGQAIDGFIAQARARLAADPTLREHPRNLLEAMIVAADQRDSGVNDRHVAANVLTMLLAGEDTTANTLAWMIYLLQRHPQALQRATINDVRVPLGTYIWCVMRHASVDERYVPNAAAFDPTRWFGAAGQGASPSSAKRVATPFGAGPRMCPGRYLALLEIKLAMAMLLGRFDIEEIDVPNGGEAAEHMAFTMAPVGLRMRLRERS